jgi:hypothetical protein
MTSTLVCSKHGTVPLSVTQECPLCLAERDGRFGAFVPLLETTPERTTMLDRIFDHVWDSFPLFLTGVIGVLLVALSPFIGFVMYAEYRSCVNTAEVIGMRYEWRAFGGCIVEYKPDKWIPLQRYFTIESLTGSK